MPTEVASPVYVTLRRPTILLFVPDMDASISEWIIDVSLLLVY